MIHTPHSWRSADSGNGTICCLCGKSQGETESFYYGRLGNAACAECLELCDTIFVQEKQKQPRSVGSLNLATLDEGMMFAPSPRAAKVHCSFCGTNYGVSGPLVEGAGRGFLCSSCCTAGRAEWEKIQGVGREHIEAQESESTDTCEPHGVFRLAFGSMFIQCLLIFGYIILFFNIIVKKIPPINFFDIEEMTYVVVGLLAISAISSIVVMIKYPVYITPIGIRIVGPAGVNDLLEWSDIAFVYKNKLLGVEYVYVVSGNGCTRKFSLSLIKKDHLLQTLNHYLKIHGIKSAPEVIN